MRGAVLLMVLSACTVSDVPRMRYLGMMVPDTVSPLCKTARAFLQIRNGTMLFIPNEGTWKVEGEAQPNGVLEGGRSESGVDKKTYDTRFNGHWSQDRAEGVYLTPRCRFRFEGLSR